MSNWFWIGLELLVLSNTCAWTYFFPDDAFAKGLIGFVIIWAIEEYRYVSRRNRMNHTIEQNAGENRIEGGVVGISGSVTKQYRPFNDCNELIEVFREKCEAEVNCSTFFPKMYKACVWVKHKEYGTENLITAFDNDNESIGGSCVFIQDMWCDMAELFEQYTFLDNSACGVEE